MLKFSLFRKHQSAITMDELRKLAIAKIAHYVELNRKESWCCCTCRKFVDGAELSLNEQDHIENAIKYQQKLLIEEHGYYAINSPKEGVLG